MLNASRMFAAFVAFILFGACAPENHQQHYPQDVTDNILYIQSLDENASKPRDIDRMYAAIGSFDLALEKGSPSELDRVRFRYWRARSYSQINEQRRLSG